MTDSIVFINGKSKCGCEMKFSSGHGEYSDVHRITPCPIHAASAQTPFIFGISDPDGGAYIEEMCVSSSASNLTEEVACLNADLVAGDPLYEVVPLYRKAAPSIPDQLAIADILDAITDEILSVDTVATTPAIRALFKRKAGEMRLSALAIPREVLSE